MAEWSGRGLQNLVRRFDSGPCLQYTIFLRSPSIAEEQKTRLNSGFFVVLNNHEYTNIHLQPQKLLVHLLIYQQYQQTRYQQNEADQHSVYERQTQRDSL